LNKSLGMVRRIERMAETQFRPDLVAVFKVLEAERDRTAVLAVAGAGG
jgi:hypothetical protein